jgi:hypothetical protein
MFKRLKEKIARFWQVLNTGQTTETSYVSVTYCEAGWRRYWKRMCARNPKFTDLNAVMKITVGEFQNGLKQAYYQSQADAKEEIDRSREEFGGVWDSVEKTLKQSR